MATLEPRELRALADRWVGRMGYGSAEFSGIVGDARHRAEGGYHISIEDQPSSNYSVTRPDDKAPPGGWPRNLAAAVDVSLNLADMKACHGRLCAVWRARGTDPRARYINAHNGWDGAPDGPGRYDWVTGTVQAASSDHEWHVHLEVRRRYVAGPEAPAAMDAIGSILAGESLAAYLARTNPAPIPIPEDDMLTPDQERLLITCERVLTCWARGELPWGVHYSMTDEAHTLPNPLAEIKATLAAPRPVVLSDADRGAIVQALAAVVGNRLDDLEHRVEQLAAARLAAASHEAELLAPSAT